MPSDPEAAIKAVVAAVESGRLTRKRIQESVAKLLAAKERVGLARKRTVNLDSLSDVLDAPEANEKAQEIADHAVTLVRNTAGAAPLSDPAHTCFVILPETRYSVGGQAFAEEVRKRQANARIATIDPTMPGVALEDAVNKLGACDTYAVAAYASVSAYRGTAALGGELPYLVQHLLASGKPVILTALGNPYLLRSFPEVAAYLATFSSVVPSERAAVKALFGEIPITGKLPVSIPGFAAVGEGLQLPARSTAGNANQN